MFKEKLNLESNTIDILINEGFSTLEELAYIPIQELFDIKNLERETVKKIREKSRNALIVQAIKREENKNNDENNLSNIKGITKEISSNLEKHGILTRENLAELDADALNKLNIKELNDYDTCANLIMSAREHWFN
jgi:N utilization substance protein A